MLHRALHRVVAYILRSLHIFLCVAQILGGFFVILRLCYSGYMYGFVFFTWILQGLIEYQVVTLTVLQEDRQVQGGLLQWGLVLGGLVEGCLVQDHIQGFLHQLVVNLAVIL